MNKNLLRIYNKKFNNTLSEKNKKNNSSTFHLATTKVSFVAFAFEVPVWSEESNSDGVLKASDEV